ncbi:MULTISPECIES: SMP-30/gluconolactonase/LRE family protein [unclassified Curtobacterium]|uniref:SMP-30/gluconolactonase/LRE family protein n=1 Tax=unclassified Curtobacterium TaxID=257496 RepID=UPI000F4A387A|nr:MULTISPECIES: SMP-30/gluconolactonase/LRE family protein [unclassified Curtobacterium]ROQ17857.1 sugar lactone lactonase YvrE [Curtobacterium sp. PhB171]ROQ28898.1 sugar lactone lactonase YvrE [Curtobacterium sp. PhB170]ROS45958.1 sugar lactone lactonase YvrE [Curtobacterium sp. PhB131]ROS67740.1 sugar lactone lactonase YvrE [Curtobacterium sp. PhB141]
MSTSATTGPVTVFSDARAVLAESIVWDPSAQLLRWTDITLGTLVTAQSDGTVVSTVPLPPPLASFQPRASGGFVAALGDTVVVTDEHGVVERELTRVEHATAGLRFNEGKCDPFGRFLVGSMNLTTGEPDGALYSVEADGTTRLLRGGFGVTNGFEWSDDGTVMYVTDTSASTIYRGSYGPDGELGELEPFVVGHAHDGLVRDDEGCSWSAVYGGGRVERYGPDGSHLETVELPTPNVTSVAFGGPDMSTLFVASARENLTEEQLEQHPSSGAILAVPTRVRGFPANTFSG